jgi:hypothetical protein
MAEFAHTITGLNNGQTETELSLRLKELVSAVSDTGKKGSLTLKLTVERNKKNAKLIEVTAEVAAKIPMPPPPSAAFLLHAGELIALEDTQMRLPLVDTRQIEAGPAIEITTARPEPVPTFEEVQR